LKEGKNMDFLRWDPLSDLRQIRQRLDHLLEGELSFPSQLLETASNTWAPLVDIYETEEAIVVEAEIAGMKKAEIEIELSGDTLTIKGERKLHPDQDYLRRERSYGGFLRSFTLGVPVTQAAIEARYEQGILQITLPKAKAARARQVKIDVS
jgi:HSP20 family protein